MTDPEPDPAEDPRLTLAEIAEELRVNPATVRLRVSRGKLKAKRAGQRKLIVQRSELNRMLDESSHRYDKKDPPDREATPGHPMVLPRRPVRVRSWSLSYVARAKVPPEVMRRAVQRLQEVGAAWDVALEASENAPPDPGFVDRLRAIAAAAEQQAEALNHARSIPGFTWAPVPDTENMILARTAPGRQTTGSGPPVDELRLQRRPARPRDGRQRRLARLLRVFRVGHRAPRDHRGAGGRRRRGRTEQSVS